MSYIKCSEEDQVLYVESIPKLFILDHYFPGNAYTFILEKHSETKLKVQILFEKSKIYTWNKTWGDNQYISVVDTWTDAKYRFHDIIPLGTDPSDGFYIVVNTYKEGQSKYKIVPWHVHFRNKKKNKTTPK